MEKLEGTNAQRCNQGTNTMSDMLELFREYKRMAQAAGYAIIVFTPEELKHYDPSQLEDYLSEKGNEAIGSCADAADEGEDED